MRVESGSALPSKWRLATAINAKSAVIETAILTAFFTHIISSRVRKAAPTFLPI
jgi:hypothetical protein